MNLIIVAALLSVVGLSAAETYTDRYDNIDVNEILGNRKLLLPYILCVLGKGRCTAEGKEIKLHIQDGMQTGCLKCTETQKVNARKIVKHIREKEAPYWEQLKTKYDPKNEFKDTYEAFLAGN